MPDLVFIDLTLTVTEARKVRLDSVTLKYKNKICPTNLENNSLQEKTIQTLIHWLKNGRLNQDEIYLLGAHLYSALLEGEIGTILQEHRNRANELLSIELAFENSKDDIASWPWEYLYCLTPGYFIAHEARFAITRLPGVAPQRPVQVSDPKVRVLFVAASPCDLDLIEFSGLLEKIEALQWVDHADHNKGQQFELLPSLVTEYVSPDDLPAKREKGELQDAKATWAGFKQMLEDLDRKGKSPHVIHFVGHGVCESRVGGQIAFADEHYGQSWVNGEDLAGVLRQYDSVKLVFLQACESAMPTPDVHGPYEAMSDVAHSLAEASIPAVVAMQSKVEIATANNFASTFYDSLVHMMPVYQAVQKGRQSISDKVASGIPVLYLLRYSNEVGVLFPATDQPIASIGPVPPIRTASGRIRCAWCGRDSMPGNKCSWAGCRAQLRCPKQECRGFVEVEAGDRWGDDEVYECKKCSAAFKKDGVVEPQQTVTPQAGGFDRQPTEVTTMLSQTSAAVCKPAVPIESPPRGES